MVSPFLLLLLLFYVALMSTLNSYQPAALGSCGSAYLPYSTIYTKAVWLSLYSLLSPNVAWLPRLLFYHPMTIIPTLIIQQHKGCVAPTPTLLSPDDPHTHSDYPKTQTLCDSHIYPVTSRWLTPTPIIQQHKRFVAPTPTPLSPDDPHTHSDYPTIQRSVWLLYTLFYHPTTPKFRDSHFLSIIQRHQCWVALITLQHQGWVAIVSSRIAQCRVTSISIALTLSNTMVVGLLLSSKSLIKSCCIVLYCIALCSVVKYSHHRTTAKLCTFRILLFLWKKKSETRMTASVLKEDPNVWKGSKERCLLITFFSTVKTTLQQFKTFNCCLSVVL